MRVMMILLFAVTLKATGYVRATIIEPAQDQTTIVYTVDGPTLQVVF